MDKNCASTPFFINVFILYYDANAILYPRGVRCVKPSCLPILREKIHVLLSIGYDSQEMIEIMDKIDQCVLDEDLLTVFEMQKKEHTDLDLAILTALLKCKL